MRGACGSNSHPDSLLFVQVYMLLSVYSLVKPIRGSNVTASELLSTIISLKYLVGEEHKEHKEHFENIIDNIINNTSPLMDIEIEDNTFKEMIDEYALTVFAGCIARKIRKSKLAKNCHECFESLCDSKNESTLERNSFLEQKSHEGLLKPSNDLYNIVLQVNITNNK